MVIVLARHNNVIVSATSPRKFGKFHGPVCQINITKHNPGSGLCRPAAAILNNFYVRRSKSTVSLVCNFMALVNITAGIFIKLVSTQLSPCLSHTLLCSYFILFNQLSTQHPLKIYNMVIQGIEMQDNLKGMLIT